MAACAIVKARRPQTRIVLGGPEVGPVRACGHAANPAVDVIVRSEGTCRSRQSSTDGAKARTLAA
jgi:hypothetical protein